MRVKAPAKYPSEYYNTQDNWVRGTLYWKTKSCMKKILRRRIRRTNRIMVEDV